jgi:hypothetical protein
MKTADEQDLFSANHDGKDYIAQLREELCTTRPARAGRPQGKRRYPLVVNGVLGGGVRQQPDLLT